MTKIRKLFLQLFGDGAGAAAPAGDGGASATESADFTAGDVLEDGTKVDKRLADRMNAQQKRFPNRYQSKQVAPAKAETPVVENVEANQPSIDDEWAELKKGKYAEQFGRDVQNAIQDRFKNQKDANDQLNNLKPMLDALIKKNGLKDGDYEALSKHVLDDDSLYEEEAEKMGMTVNAYKDYKALEAEAEQARQMREQQEQNAFYQQHLMTLTKQGDQLKQIFPDFDLRKELQDPAFRRMTAPNGGLSVEQAYMALHYRDIMPQAVQTGVQRAQAQISASLQANAQRPAEGAMRQNAALETHVDIRNMPRKERENLIERARRGERIEL